MDEVFGPQKPRRFLSSSTREGGEDEAGFDMNWLRQVFRRHLWAGLIIFILVLAGGLALTLLMPPRYEAQVKIKIEEKNQVFALEEYLNFEKVTYDFYKTQVKLLQSRNLIRQIIEKIDLTSQLEYQPRESMAFLPFLETNPADFGDILSATGEIEGATFYRMSHVIDRYLNHLTVAADSQTPQLVYLTFEAQDPELAARVANTHAETYIQISTSSNALFTDEYINGLNEQLRQLDEQSMSKGQEILEFKKGNGFFQIQGMSSYDPVQDIDDRLSRIRLQLGEASEDFTRYQTAFEALYADGAVDDKGKVKEDLPTSDALVQLRKQRTDLMTRWAEVKQRYLERHPVYLETKQQADVLEKAIQTEVDSYVSRARSAYLEAKSRVEELTRQEQELIGEKYRRDAQWSTLQDLEQTREQLIKQKQVVLEDLQKAKGSLESQKETGNRLFNIVDYAEVPLQAANRIWTRILPLLLAAALGAALAGVLLLEFQDRSVRTPEQIEQITGVSVLGCIPLFRSYEISRVEGRVEEDVNSPASEAFIALRTRFLFSDMLKRSQTIVITSSVEREGKSTVGVNLASSLASVGKKVAYIDCDLRRPSLHHFFGENRTPGLSDVIKGSEHYSIALFETDVPGLFLLPAGASIARPNEILTSSALDDLLQQLKEEFDYVFIDTPPVLATPDTSILSPRCDVTLLVVRYGKIERSDLASTLDHIQGSGGSVFAAILNGVPPKERSVYARYGYGYASEMYRDVEAGA